MSVQNLKDLCRICGEFIEDEFESVKDNEEKIYKYLPIKENDKGFPKKICEECLSTLLNWDAFYSRCEETQTKFASLPKRKRNISGTAKKQKKEPTTKKCAAKKIIKTRNQRKLTDSCKFCKFSTENQEELNNHLIAVHCELVFCCDVCKNYKPRDDLIAHMTEHAQNPPQSTDEESNYEETSTTKHKKPCPNCDREFVTDSGLTYHINANHTGAIRYNCDKCEQFFPCKRALLNHHRSYHSKKKDFKCTECGKRFKTDSTLYAHYKTHSDEKPYKCTDCGKTFKFKHHLDIHSIQHGAKEKIYECTLCDKTFAVLNNLTKHRKVHNTTIDYVCHICGIKTIQKRYLRDHMRRMHQTRMDSLTLKTTN